MHQKWWSQPKLCKTYSEILFDDSYILYYPTDFNFSYTFRRLCLIFYNCIHKPFLFPLSTHKRNLRLLKYTVVIFNIDYSELSNLDRGFSRVKSSGVILVVRRPHLNWYSSFKQYLRRPSTKGLSNVWVCCKPFDARYIWLNTCNPHAFSCGVCSVHVTGVVVWNPGNRSDTLPPWVYNLVM